MLQLIANAFIAVYGIIMILKFSCKKSVLIIQYNRFNNFFLITKRTEHLNVFKKSE